MIQMTLDIPEGALTALREEPVMFVRELQIAAAVKWPEPSGFSVSLPSALKMSEVMTYPSARRS